MTAAQLRSTMRVLVLAVVVVVPLVFWRGVSGSFEVVKATALWGLGGLVVAALAMYLGLNGWRAVPRQVLVATGALMAALVVVTLTSMSPIDSLVGQPDRYTGLGTYLCVIAVFIAAALAFDSRRTQLFNWICTLVALPIANYALLQVSNHDPYSWQAESFTNLWTSTFANPNVSAAFVAVVLPLVAYTMLRRDAPMWVSVLGGAAFGACTACLSVFSSFQGPVAALTTVLFLGAWAVWTHASLGDWLVAGFLAACVLIVPALTPSASLIIISAGGVAALLALRPMIARLQAPVALRAHRRGIAIGAGVGLGVLVIGGSRRALGYVEQGWTTGFLERGDFYRTASAIFRQHPVLGSGLDTFGLLFTRLRPAGHAERFEQWISTSAHSVPLGMFANGGLVLGLAYLVFVGLIARTLFRCLRATSGQDRVLVGSVGAAWLAFQVQSLVSIESLVLFSMHFITAGLIVALAIEHGVLRSTTIERSAEGLPGAAIAEVAAEVLDRPAEEAVALAVAMSQPVGVVPLGHGGGASAAYVAEPSGAWDDAPSDDVASMAEESVPVAARRVSPVVVVASVVLCFAVWWTVSARPIRAMAAADAGNRAVLAVDDELALREYSRAIELAPWVNSTRVVRSAVARIARNSDAALAGLVPVLGSVEGNPYLLEQASMVATAAGDDDMALALLEQALATNPKGPAMRERAAGYYVKAGERAEAAGDIALARTRYQRALELMPGLAAAEDALADL